jgi:hypothetical protein
MDGNKQLTHKKRHFAPRTLFLHKIHIHDIVINMQRFQSLTTRSLQYPQASLSRHILGMRTYPSFQIMQRRPHILLPEGQSKSPSPVPQQLSEAHFAELSRRLATLEKDSQDRYLEALNKQAETDALLTSLARSMHDDQTTNWFCRKFFQAVVYVW